MITHNQHHICSWRSVEERACMSDESRAAPIFVATSQAISAESTHRDDAELAVNVASLWVDEDAAEQ